MFLSPISSHECLPRGVPDHRVRHAPVQTSPSLCERNQPVIDVLVIYTPNARLDSTSLSGADRSSSQMETDIAASFQGANDALEASGVNFSLRVVHMREVRYRPSTTLSARQRLYPTKQNKISFLGDRELRLAEHVCRTISARINSLCTPTLYHANVWVSVVTPANPAMHGYQ